MRIKTGMLLLLIILPVFGSLPITVSAQSPLPLDEEISDSLPLYGQVLQYTVDLRQGTFFEAILAIPERDFALDFALITENHELVISNQSMNYPNFQGAYLIAEVPTTQTYILQITVPQDFSERVDFTLLALVHEGDEAQLRALRTYDVVEGVIGPDRDADTFSISLRAGSPVLLVVTTPNNILDSVIGIIGPSDEVIAYNDDFFGTASSLFYIPETNGTYQVIIQGKYIESRGPYRLIVNPAPLYNPPFVTDEEIAEPGDMVVYQVPMNPNQVYDFWAYAVDDFYPILVVTDELQNVIASAQATPDYPAAVIEGFTPVNDETLYVYVMGDTIDLTGFYGLDVSIRADEEDGIELPEGSVFQGVIGPVGDVDEYVFFAEEGQDYSILVTPTQHYLDPAVRVLDQDGNELYFNDDSADGVFSILSGIDLPEWGEYRIQVSASSVQDYLQRLTGVYLIQLASGSTFDWGAPRIAEDRVLITPTAAGVHITIPTAAVADDTYPLSATLTLDQKGGDVFFTIGKDTPVELDIEASPDEIFFLTMNDSSQRKNSVGPVTIPGPRIIADLDGVPTALAVDRDNNLYIADSWIGGIVKYTIDGASEVVLSGEQTGGGTFGPNAVAFNPDGDLFYANAAMHSIVKVLPGGATETFAAGLNFPLSFTFDKEGVMYLAQIGSDTIDKLYPDGMFEPFASGIRNPSSLAFSPEGILYACNAAQGESGIYRIDSDGESSVFVEAFSDSLSGLAFDRDGNLYVTDENIGFLYRIDPDGERIVFTQDIGATAGLAFGHGEYEKTLFVSSSWYFNDPNRTPFYYEQRLIAVPTGRVGIPVPDIVTAVRGWMMY